MKPEQLCETCGLETPAYLAHKSDFGLGIWDDPAPRIAGKLYLGEVPEGLDRKARFQWVRDHGIPGAQWETLRRYSEAASCGESDIAWLQEQGTACSCGKD